MKMRARLKRKNREAYQWVYVLGVRRVRRGSILVLSIRWREGGSRTIGWIRADRPDPVVQWGRP